MSTWADLLKEVEEKAAKREGDDEDVVRHESEGWIGLEQALRKLQVEDGGAMGPYMPGEQKGGGNNELTDETATKILEKVKCLAAHNNRFVREAVYGIIEVILKHSDITHGDTLATITSGLTDNWSQVRYRATHSMKAYLAKHTKPEIYPLILPRLCLNRYYIAEGVRLETQRLWVKVCGDRGIQLVSEHLPYFVAYYAAQVKEKNHAVREAACHCIAELVSKVPGVEPHIETLLKLIDEACDDPSWPVRDIACVSSSKIVLKYPECCQSKLPAIYKRFLYQAEDPIPSVRKHAGEALANYAKINNGCRVQVVDDVSKMLKRIFTQPETSVSATDLSNVTQFGVAKRVHDNDVEVHTNGGMFSCGSLAPGPSTARVLGGCSGGHGVARTGLDPWFATDSAVHTIRFMTDLNLKTDGLLDGVVPTLQVKTFIHYPQYWQTVWTSVPTIVRNIGKRAVTEWVNTVLPDLFTCLQCDNKLASTAAADCIIALRKLYGDTVWEGKLSVEQRAFMKHSLLQ
eukprot:TRINITY_DN11451_c1_g1_i1.p1 TRINITY_DN11451_c1_g1~~TRINITY_DN11451_c1_g1_i1.p1  ORF type:complete len:535 (+),score=114.80 TRINITY_DN11451_c1_g1_i1:60-1607(+)